VVAAVPAKTRIASAVTKLPLSLPERVVRSANRVRVYSLLLAIVSTVVGQSTAIADETRPLIKRLDDPTRAKVLAALAGLVLLGFAMVLLTWLAARVVQRYRHGTSYFRPTVRPGEHAWAKKPLIPPDAEPPPPDA
jgi:hypothetical protein